MKNRSSAIPEPRLRILLDQNVPAPVTDWLRGQRPQWDVHHTNELGFAGQSDEFLNCWAQENKAVIVTFDEDFADIRLRQTGTYHHRQSKDPGSTDVMALREES